MALLLRAALTLGVVLLAAGIFAGCTSNAPQQSTTPGGNATITNSSALENTTNPFSNSTMQTPNATTLPGP